MMNDNDISLFDPDLYGRIVCAALLHNDCIYMGRAGHHVIFPMEPLGVLRCAKQGFVTEYGYFVDRVTGLVIAEYYDQIWHKHSPKDKLMSEDIRKEGLDILVYRNEYSYKENK